jgi:hypothetical protein
MVTFAVFIHGSSLTTELMVKLLPLIAPAAVLGVAAGGLL